MDNVLGDELIETDDLPNLRLTKNDWDALDNAISEAVQVANDCIAEVEKYLKRYYINCSAEQISAFDAYIESSKKRPPVATGFAKLDDILGGGLREGLYAIGAISSLGKTAFTLQIADNLAEDGRTVLIFSLEMSRFELMARSMSRLSYIMDPTKGRVLAKTTLGILDGRRRLSYSEQEQRHLMGAKLQYQALADKRIFIWETDDDISVPMINDTIAEHIKRTKRRPIVIVDYLQILPPPQNTTYGNLTERQAVDKNVVMLKKISRKFRIPLIVVSSFNRESYKKQVSMEAFKESGGIEYSADVLLGLQYKEAFTEEALAEARRRPIREIELVILKNRQGEAGSKIDLKYCPAFNFYYEPLEGGRHENNSYRHSSRAGQRD